MNLNDLLSREGIDPAKVLVLRHAPREARLRRALPLLAAERPDLFMAYQQSHGTQLERAMNKIVGSGYIASFIGMKGKKALFICIYSIRNAKPLSHDEYWGIPANAELRSIGMEGFGLGARESIQWFDLEPRESLASYKGKLIVGWPGKERSWYRWANRVVNVMPVLSILEENALPNAMSPRG